MEIDPILREVHRTLITANHILHHHGVVDAFGHISVRHPHDSSIYIMCGYMAPALVSSSADLVEYRVADSSTVDPDAKKGYSERFIHGEIFRKFRDVNCVVHSHAEEVLPYVIGGVPLKPVYHMGGFLGPHVPIFDIEPLYDSSSQRDMLVNNARLGTALASHFSTSPSSPASTPDHTVVLMRRHGFTAVAHSIETAVYRAIYTAINARAQTGALATRANFAAVSASESGEAGMMFALDGEGGVGLTDEQMVGCATMTETFQDKPWRLWVREVEGRGIYVNRLA